MAKKKSHNSGTYFRDCKTDNTDDPRWIARRCTLQSFGAEIHTLGSSAPESFPDTDPVMVCLASNAPHACRPYRRHVSATRPLQGGEILERYI